MVESIVAALTTQNCYLPQVKTFSEWAMLNVLQKFQNIYMKKRSMQYVHNDAIDTFKNATNLHMCKYYRELLK